MALLSTLEKMSYSCKLNSLHFYVFCCNIIKFTKFYLKKKRVSYYKTTLVPLLPSFSPHISQSQSRLKCSIVNHPQQPYPDKNKTENKGIQFSLVQYLFLNNISKGQSYNFQYYRPELSMGLPAGIGSGSLISTTTQSDIKNVFATEDACSRQHLTT